MRAVLICPDRDLASELETALASGTYMTFVRRAERYPSEHEAGRMLRAHAPEAVFLSFESPETAIRIVREIETQAPELQVVALHRSCEPRILMEAMRAGVREFLHPPFSADGVQETLARIADVAKRIASPAESKNLILAFLPSKAGVGTSTVALNIAVALSEVPDTPTLLADFDLNNGILAFMLKLDCRHSVVDAAESADHLDEYLWPRLVAKAGEVDLLASGDRNLGFRIEAAQIRSILDFARRHYRAICIDLSGNMEQYSIEIMNEAKRIFVVCTPELPSLHLAREKLSFLRSVDLESRVSVVLNRAQRRSLISTAEVEKLLGMPVRLTLPNDYAGVHRALTDGQRVAPESELGKRFRAIAEGILEKRPLDTDKRRFVEYFSLLPARYSLLPSGRKSVM